MANGESLNETAAETKIAKLNYNAKVTAMIKVTPSLMKIRIRPKLTHENKAQALPSYTPGQYAAIGLLSSAKHTGVAKWSDDRDPLQARAIKRVYSISYPLEELDQQSTLPTKLNEHQQLAVDEWEFYISLVQANADVHPALTPRLFALDVGDELFLGPALGHYNLNPNDLAQHKTLFLCSTGTGLAPHNAFVRYLLEKKYKGKIVVLSCSPYLKEHLAYEKSYLSLRAHFPQLYYQTLVTREAQLPKTYIQDVINQNLWPQAWNLVTPTPEHASFYLCGNPAMISAVVDSLSAKGFTLTSKTVPNGNIHFEKYWT